MLMSVQMKFTNVIAMQPVPMTQWEHTHVNAMMDILVMAFSVKVAIHECDFGDL